MRVSGYLLLSVALVAFLSSPTRALAAQQLDTAKILSLARAATGGAALDRATSLNENGQVIIGGLRGSFEEWNDSKTGSYAESDDAGFFTGAQGFDGANAWNRDSANVTWIDAGKQGVYTSIAIAYLTNDCYLRPAQRGLVKWTGTRKEHGTAYDILNATPPKGLPIEIWLNAKTHLAARAVVTVGISATTFTFDNYHPVHGVRVPFHVHTVSDLGNETDTTVTSAQANPPNIGDHIKMVMMHPNDYGIAGATQTTVPVQIIDNHVYIKVMLNGKGPYQFAFDTGGSNVVDSDVAKDLGLTSAGSMQGSGVGNQTEGLGFTKIGSLGVGAATLSNQYFAVLPIRQGFSIAAGVPIDGLIGFEVLARFVATFDYGNSRLTLGLPAAAAPAASGADVIPFVFNNTIPQLPCELNAVHGDCSVDTGSRASLSVLTPFGSAHPELIPANATAPGVNGFGVGGASIGRLGRLQSLQIGNTVLQNLIADFSVQTKGYFANPFIAANIGGGVWRRFTVTFDYAHQLMTLVPNNNFTQKDAYDRSGLFLIAPGGQATIADVRPGTPAADAGLARGEQLISIDGKSTAGMDLLTMRQTLSGPAGTVVRLVVADKTGVQHSVSVTLRDYV